MPRTEFHALPDDARIWIFSSGRPLDATEEETLLDRVDGFLETWNAHGNPLTCARDWIEGRFLVVGVDERTAPPSGCSIDAMVGVLKELESRLDVELTGHGPVFWRDDSDRVRRSDRNDFVRLAEAGEVDAGTPVFDATLTRAAELRAGGFEKPAGESWHARAFPLGG
jgi:hypothetical protein